MSVALLFHFQNQKVAAIFDRIERPHLRNQIIGPDQTLGAWLGFASMIRKESLRSSYAPARQPALKVRELESFSETVHGLQATTPSPVIGDVVGDDIGSLAARRHRGDGHEPAAGAPQPRRPPSAPRARADNHGALPGGAHSPPQDRHARQQKASTSDSSASASSRRALDRSTCVGGSGSKFSTE